MRTLIIIAAGLVLAAVFVFGGRFFGQTAALGAKIFIPLWFIAAAVNMWLGVAKAGYSFMEELPIFLAIFAVPAAAAGFVWWKYS
jgi:type IV secretory pathway TrbL component